MSVKKKSSTRQREEAIEDTDGTWVRSSGFFRYLKTSKRVPLNCMKDSDELCLFLCGHIGWASHTRCIGKKGKATAVKGQPAERKTATLNLVTAASGKMRASALLGKSQDWGVTTDKGRKLKMLREMAYPCCTRAHETKFKDEIVVASNESGFHGCRHVCQSCSRQAV